MSRCPDVRRARRLVLLLPLAAAPAWPSQLDVSGRVAGSEPRLSVSVTLANRGDRPTGPVDVKGELAGQRAEGRLASGLGPRAEGSLTLEFAEAPRRPGLHALTLSLEHPLEGPADAAGNPPLASEPAFLLLAFGASPGGAVRIEPEPLSLDLRGTLEVRLSSSDGRAVRVRLRALTPRGLRVSGDPIDVEVPPRGATTAHVRLLRAGAPRGGREALLLVAETPDGPLARTSVAAAAVDVRMEPSRLLPLRPLLFAAGLGLVALALGHEAWRRRSARRHAA